MVRNLSLRQFFIAAASPSRISGTTSTQARSITSSTVVPNAPYSRKQVALVQGSSRGIGLEFVRQLLYRPGCQVIATCRDPTRAHQLEDLRRTYPSNLEVVPLDVTSEESVQAAASLVSGRFTHIDLLVNTAGILHIPGRMMPETSLARLSAESLNLSFQTNAIGPMLVCQHFMPLLAAAKEQGRASPERPAVIANLSARVGSIGDNRLGGWYAYRGSKAALNQMTRTMAIESARRRHSVACLLLHPGTTKTDLSAPFQKNVKPDKLFPVEKTVGHLLDIIDGATMEDNGRFIAWDGEDIVW